MAQMQQGEMMQGGMPQEQGAQPQEGQDRVGKLVQATAAGLAAIAKALEQSTDKPPEFAERAQAILSEFQALMEEVASGAEQGNATAAQEAGGARGARPVM